MDFFCLMRIADREEERQLRRSYIAAVRALDDHILQVDYVSGSCLLLDMKPYLDKIRFRPLARFGIVSARTGSLSNLKP